MIVVTKMSIAGGRPGLPVRGIGNRVVPNCELVGQVPSPTMIFARERYSKFLKVRGAKTAGMAPFQLSLREFPVGLPKMSRFATKNSRFDFTGNFGQSPEMWAV